MTEIFQDTVLNLEGNDVEVQVDVNNDFWRHRCGQPSDLKSNWITVACKDCGAIWPETDVKEKSK